MQSRTNAVTQGQLLLLAISFLTRVPVPLNFTVTGAHLNQASRYFALVGLLLGGLLALAYSVFQLLLPPSISLLLMMAVGMLLTGAFHEDGWADVWDGFGGGWQVEQKLAIMKDSRLGTYGAAALFIILLVKFQSLLFLSDSVLSETTLSVLSAIVIGQCLSRAVATSLIFSMDYVSADATSKVKPLAMHLSVTSLVTLVLTGAALLICFIAFGVLLWQTAIVMMAVLLILRQLFIYWFKQQLGGYTGDCLGAAQQLSEVVIYLTLVSLL